MPGMTAYFGLLDVGKPQSRRDRRGLGRGRRGRQRRRPDRQDQGLPRRSASPAARRSAAYLVDELGFDAAIDYKREDVEGGAARALPERHRRLLRQRRRRDPRRRAGAARARRADRDLRRDLAVQQHRRRCKGPANYLSLLVNRASMTGMVVFDYADRYAEAAAEMAGWMAAGKLKSREDIGGAGALPGHAAEAVQGREHRQAGAEGCVGGDELVRRQRRRCARPSGNRHAGSWVRFEDPDQPLPGLRHQHPRAAARPAERQVPRGRAARRTSWCSG